MEVSSHALELGRLQGCSFQVAIFTNLGRDHLDFHTDMEHYFRAKSRLFVDYEPRCAVINQDDPWGRRLMNSIPGRVVTCGLGEGADVTAREVTANSSGLCFRVTGGGEGFEIRTSLLGRHNVYNILSAVAAAQELKVEVGAIQAGIAAVDRVPGRWERVSAAGEPLVVIDYAHTPEAIAIALREARALCEGRLILLFGCGGDRDRGKRPLMGRVAAGSADLTILTTDNPRSEDPMTILREIEAGFLPQQRAAGALRVVPDRRRAIRDAIAAAEEKDMVVIAGKGHENCQVLRDETVPFSDRQEAVLALRERGK
jgi:UDP-N-acetylmuramoyl-L-alanyl-D-glutamate--2,6-diaminopimelate ligase